MMCEQILRIQPPDARITLGQMQPHLVTYILRILEGSTECLRQNYDASHLGLSPWHILSQAPLEWLVL